MKIGDEVSSTNQYEKIHCLYSVALYKLTYSASSHFVDVSISTRLTTGSVINISYTSPVSPLFFHKNVFRD